MFLLITKLLDENLVRKNLSRDEVSRDEDEKAWCLDTLGFIPKKIQWHIHAGPWSLVN